MPTSTPDSCTLAQKGSNSSSANDRRRPLKSGTGAGRMSTTLAPFSTTYSSSRIASSTMLIAITGGAKIRCSYWNVHSSSIQRLRAWMTMWVARGSSASRSSRRLASVGHMIARSMLSSSIIRSRAAGSKNAAGDSM